MRQRRLPLRAVQPRRFTAELLEDRRMLALTTTDLASGLTAADLAQALVGPGISISNVTFTGDNSAGGKFLGGISEGLGVESGVVLSSGRVQNAIGPNDSDGITGSFDLPGDANLDALVPGSASEDAAVLEFDFEATGGTFSFQYVFASEEYNEFVNSRYNDVFGFFLNGQNIALIPNTTTPVAINNLNNLLNSQYFNDNDYGDFGGNSPFPTQADGFTLVLQASAIVSPGTNHIKLAIADVGDSVLDSWVFLAGESFVSGEVELEIDTSDVPDPVAAGEQLTYTINFVNHGPDRATAVLVQDTLPANVTFVSATISAGTIFQAGGVVSAAPGALDPGEGGTITITVVPTVEGTITNRATIQAAQVDLLPDNNTWLEDTEVTRFKVSGPAQREGNIGPTDFVISISQLAGKTDTKVLAFSTADGSALSNIDYLPVGGTITFLPGETQKFVTVQVLGETNVEPDEAFFLIVNDATDFGLDRAQGTAVIVNDDSNVSINDIVIAESNSGAKEAVFTVSIGGAIHVSEIQVSYYTLDGTATAGSDYLPRSGMISFPVGVSSRNVTVPIVNDLFNESTETFTVNLASPFNAELAKTPGVATVTDDDPIPALYVNDVHVTTTEAGLLTAVFTVALDRPSGQNVAVNFATVDNTAISGIDYVGLSGGLVFAPGVTTLSVTVPILTSSQYAANKTFLLNLLAPVNAIFGDPQGIGRIIFAPPPVNEFIIDDGDPLYSRSGGGWTNLTNTLAYNLDYDYHAAGNGSGQATWNFDNIPQGTYQVLAKWIPFSNRATNAPYTILDGSTPLSTVLVNQQLFPTGDQSNGITWQSLGMFSTSTGILRVRLGDNANGYVIADAIRLVRDGISVQVPEMDVAAFGRSVNTGDVTPALEDGTDFGIVASQSSSVTHTFNIANNGNAALHLTGSPRVEIWGAHAGDFTVVTQPNATVAAGYGATFQIQFHPSAEGLRQAVVSIANDDDSEHPYLFHVQGTGAAAGPSQFIIDDQGSGFLKSANWATNENTYGYGNSVSTVAGGNGSNWARWTFGGLAPGEYDVYATWVAFGNRATNAPFTLADGNASQHVVQVNQQQWPSTPLNGTNWGAIGSIDVTTGELKVSLTNAANGYVVADAVMIVRRNAPAMTLMAHNATMPLDVNGDRRVSSFDALLVVNQLLTAGSAVPQAVPLTGSLTTGAGFYRDVNGDGQISPRDALLVISHLLTAPAAAPQATTATIAGPAAEVAVPAAGTAELAAIDIALSVLDLSDSYSEPVPAIRQVPNQLPAANLAVGASEAASRKTLEYALTGVSEVESGDETDLIEEDAPL